MTIGIDASRPNEKEKTGTEWYAYHIIQNLKKIDRLNSYRLYSMDPLRDGLENLPRNFEACVLKSWTELLWTQTRLSWEMAVNPPDVLFVPAHTIPLIHPKVTVLTVHDLGFEHFPDLYRKVPIGPLNPVLRLTLNLTARTFTLGKYGSNELDYHRWAMRFGIRHSTHIIAISEYTKKDLIARFGAEEKKITVIPHAFDPSLYFPAKGSSKNKLIRRFNPYFLFVGRIEKKKNISTLLSAYAIFRRDNPPGPKLVLIGKPGFGYGDFKKQIFVFPPYIKKDIHFLGWLPEKDTAEFYRHAQAFVFPTNFEGFGIGVIQAMAAGIPVITSNVTSLPEVAGGAALLIEPSDLVGLSKAMSQVGRTDIRGSLIAKGLRRAKDFSWQKSALTTLSVFKKAYAQSRASS